MISITQWEIRLPITAPNTSHTIVLWSSQKNMAPPMPKANTSSTRMGIMLHLKAIAFPADSEGRLRYSSRARSARATAANRAMKSAGMCLPS